MWKDTQSLSPGNGPIRTILTYCVGCMSIVLSNEGHSSRNANIMTLLSLAQICYCRLFAKPRGPIQDVDWPDKRPLGVSGLAMASTTKHDYRTSTIKLAGDSDSAAVAISILEDVEHSHSRLLHYYAFDDTSASRQRQSRSAWSRFKPVSASCGQLMSERAVYTVYSGIQRYAVILINEHLTCFPPNKIPLLVHNHVLSLP